MKRYFPRFFMQLEPDQKKKWDHILNTKEFQIFKGPIFNVTILPVNDFGFLVEITLKVMDRSS